MPPKQPFVNHYWRRLAEARPRLNDQARVTRQVVRGRLWYVLQHELSGRQFRLTPEAWCFVGLLDGRRTVAEAMAAAEERLGEAAPGQEEVLRLLTQLHGLGAISSVGTASDTASLHRQAESLRRRRLLQQFRSPLAIRIPLLDPDRILERLLPLGRLVFSLAGFFVWLAVVGYGLSTALIHLDALTDNFADRVLSAGNVALMILVFAVLKLFHEFGHGLAVKRWGGEVHEMGIMLLVLIPIPYVDASAANAFASRMRRLVVSGAGMYVEMFLAAVAVILWSRIEPGAARAALYNAALIGSVSTLLFNINPLLRFDGYYILSDMISIPNLGTRGSRFFRYLLERRLLGLEDASTTEQDPVERRWLLGYNIAATCYRFFIVGVIAFFVAQKLFFVGVVLAIWAVGQMLLLPVLGAFRFLLFSPRLRDRRAGAWGRSSLALAAVAALLFLVPMPRSTSAHGVIWVPEAGEIVAETDGFVEQVLVDDGAGVEAEQVLLVAANMPLEAERDRLLARLDALEAQYRSEFVTDRVAAKLTAMEISHSERRLADLREKLAMLEIRAAVDGRFQLAVAQDMIGRYVRRGERLGFVVPPEDTTVRVSVRQNDIGLIRTDLREIEVLSVELGTGPVAARLVRAVPAASAQLPSMALSTIGGGDISVVPDEQGRQRALEELFHFELEVDQGALDRQIGQKVHVKFVHSMEPAGLQLWRRLRQLFLSELNV